MIHFSKSKYIRREIFIFIDNNEKTQPTKGGYNLEYFQALEMKNYNIRKEEEKLTLMEVEECEKLTKLCWGWTTGL